jgi:hypothetical protein
MQQTVKPTLYSTLIDPVEPFGFLESSVEVLRKFLLKGFSFAQSNQSYDGGCRGRYLGFRTARIRDGTGSHDNFFEHKIFFAHIFFCAPSNFLRTKLFNNFFYTRPYTPNIKVVIRALSFPKTPRSSKLNLIESSLITYVKAGDLRYRLYWHLYQVFASIKSYTPIFEHASIFRPVFLQRSAFLTRLRGFSPKVVVTKYEPRFPGKFWHVSRSFFELKLIYFWKMVIFLYF